MHKALNVFNLENLFKSIQAKNEGVINITQDINSPDKVKVLLCRTPGDDGSFIEPHNVSISKTVLKPETVKVYCEEYLMSLKSDVKDVEILKESGNVFHLAVISDKPEVKQQNLSKK